VTEEKDLAVLSTERKPNLKKKKTNNNLLFRRCNCAMFVPCAAHSLNVVGTSAAEFSTEACHFFMLLEEVYTFFVRSTERWKKIG
jgi:hypothetical protein